MHWSTPERTPEERRRLGQARRKQVGRQQHGEFHPKSRPTSAREILARVERGRIPALLRLKHRMMAVSPFAYFRGAAPVMAADLAAAPTTGLIVQLCGDAHVRNLGAFAAPDGHLVFDINDFDETIRGPFEWDLKRMAASLVLAGRESGHKESSAQDAVLHCIERYAAQMRAFAKMPLIEVARFPVHRLGSVEPVHDALLKAERASPQHTLAQLTGPGKTGKDPRRFLEQPPTLTRVSSAQAAKILAALADYAETLEPQRRHLLSLYRPVDVAFKVVGAGSVGLRDYCIYFEGNGPGDPLFLQMKEEAPSCWAPYLPDACPPAHNGQRVVEGQRAMQVQSDPFLGFARMGNRDYLVRQLNDHKGTIELDDLADGGLTAFAEISGELLARGHARSSDPAILSGYLGSGDGFAESLARFGSAYADQTEKDCAALRRTIKPLPPQ